MDDATSLCCSLVAFLAKTTKVISPGCTIFKPCSLETILHPGGTMLETFTRLQYWMPASLSANSKDCSCSLCLPTPFVRKKNLGIMIHCTKDRHIFFHMLTISSPTLLSGEY